MWALKAAVIAMGGLIVAGLIVVAVTIANRLGSDPASDGGEATAPIAVPPGAVVIETALDDGLIALRVRLADGATRVLVYDRATGRRIGSHAIVEAR